MLKEEEKNNMMMMMSMVIRELVVKEFNAINNEIEI